MVGCYRFAIDGFVQLGRKCKKEFKIQLPYRDANSYLYAETVNVVRHVKKEALKRPVVSFAAEACKCLFSTCLYSGA